MEIGASVASKTVACLDLENKIEKSGQAVLKAVELQSRNEMLEAVEEVLEEVEETRSQLKEGFQEVADAFMRLEESLPNGLDALEDRQAEHRSFARRRRIGRRSSARRSAARREISAGEAHRHAALYGKVSEIAARMSGATAP
jgi:DNA repair ATPase RecN